MRILFTFTGGAGHFVPLVPVARAAAAAGHEVAFTCAAGMAPVVAARGFAVMPMLPGEPMRAPERRPLMVPDDEHELHVLREYYGGRLMRQRADAIPDRCAEWRPDLLVCDEADFGCAQAAERVGLPLAMVHVCAPGFMPEDLAIDADLVLSAFPETYRADAAHRFRAQDVASAAGDEVYLTLGTIFPMGWSPTAARGPFSPRSPTACPRYCCRWAPTRRGTPAAATSSASHGSSTRSRPRPPTSARRSPPRPRAATQPSGWPARSRRCRPPRRPCRCSRRSRACVPPVSRA
jgi:UDP:flavonoid glycosyltransferase YjiC (YdhE family)